MGKWRHRNSIKHTLTHPLDIRLYTSLFTSLHLKAKGFLISFKAVSCERSNISAGMWSVKSLDLTPSFPAPAPAHKPTCCVGDTCTLTQQTVSSAPPERILWLAFCNTGEEDKDFSLIFILVLFWIRFILLEKLDNNSQSSQGTSSRSPWGYLGWTHHTLQSFNISTCIS